MTRIIIAGAKGKMGLALLRCAQSAPGVAVAATLELGEDLHAIIDGADVLIDFTAHQCTLALARTCASRGKAMVIGTTGHTDTERREVSALSAAIPMVWSANFSTGVNVLFHLTRRAAELLDRLRRGDRGNASSPQKGRSQRHRGGAGPDLAQARGQSLEEVGRYGRHGEPGARAAEEIGIHSIRGGDVVGDHTVIFAAEGERLELTHKAASRDTFARGALRAARWVAGQKPGLYDMQDVLGIRREK